MFTVSFQDGVLSLMFTLKAGTSILEALLCNNPNIRIDFVDRLGAIKGTPFYALHQ